MAIVICVGCFALEGVQCARKFFVVPPMGKVRGYDVGTEYVFGIVNHPIFKSFQVYVIIFIALGIDNRVPAVGKWRTFNSVLLFLGMSHGYVDCTSRRKIKTIGFLSVDCKQCRNVFRNHASEIELSVFFDG